MNKREVKDIVLATLREQGINIKDPDFRHNGKPVTRYGGVITIGRDEFHQEDMLDYYRLLSEHPEIKCIMFHSTTHFDKQDLERILKHFDLISDFD